MKFDKMLEKINKLEPLLRLIEVCVVVFGTIYISTKANMISEKQLEVEQVNIQPIFDITEDKDYTLRFSCVSGEYKSIDINTIAFLRVDYDSDNGTRKQEYISITDFYDGTSAWGKGKNGYICDMFPNSYSGKFDELQPLIFETEQINEGFVNLCIYTKIEYIDMVNEKYENYYSVWDGAGLIDNKDGKELFEMFYDNTKQICTKDLTMENVLEMIK